MARRAQRTHDRARNHPNDTDHDAQPVERLVHRYGFLAAILAYDDRPNR
jgi:hypothetical protein